MDCGAGCYGRNNIFEDFLGRTKKPPRLLSGVSGYIIFTHALTSANGGVVAEGATDC